MQSFARPLLGLVFSVGCVTAEGTLAPDGSGRLELVYVPGRHATIRSETKRLGSDHVTVESIAPRDRWTVAAVTFDDVTRIPGAAAFAGATITRTRDGNTETLRMAIPPPDDDRRRYLAWVHDKEPGATSVALSLALPGAVRDTDRRAQASGAHVTWRIDLDEWATEPGIDLWVRYDTPA